MSNLPKVIELDREGLYFVSRDGDYWVYVDAFVYYLDYHIRRVGM